MNVPLELIDANPNRNRKSHPLDQEHVAELVQSIEQHGWWEGLVARPNPDKPGRYQLAFGHHRLEALRKAGKTEVQLQVGTFSEVEMVKMMMRENASQRSLNSNARLEDLEQGIRLLDRIVQKSKDAEEFAREMGGPGSAPGLDKGQGFQQVKKEVITEGFSRDFIRHWLPISVDDKVLRSVTDALFRERRIAAATQAAEKAEAEGKPEEAKKQRKKKADAESTPEMKLLKALGGSMRAVAAFSATLRALEVPEKEHANALKVIAALDEPSVAEIKKYLTQWWWVESGQAKAEEMRKQMKEFRRKYDSDIDRYLTGTINDLVKSRGFEGAKVLIENANIITPEGAAKELPRLEKVTARLLQLQQILDDVLRGRREKSVHSEQTRQLTAG